MAGINFADPYDPNAPPRSMADGLGQRMQGMFGGLSRGFKGGANALNPYSNRLLAFSAGMLGGGPSDAMKGLIAGGVLDRESADRKKLNEAIAGLKGQSGVLSGLNDADWNYLSAAGPEAVGGAFAAGMKGPDYGDKYKGYLQAKAEGYEGDWMQYQEKIGSDNAITVNTQPSKFSDIQNLRKEFESQEGVSRYRKSIPLLKSMATSVNDLTPAGDYNFVYGMAQIMDPTSSVHQGEMGMVVEGQSIPATLKQQIQKLTMAGGPGLTPEYRKQLMAAVSRRVQEYEAQAASEEEFFRNLAAEAGVDPEIIVRGREPMPELGAAADPNVPFTVEP